MNKNPVCNSRKLVGIAGRQTAPTVDHLYLLLGSVVGYRQLDKQQGQNPNH